MRLSPAVALLLLACRPAPAPDTETDSDTDTDTDSDTDTDTDTDSDTDSDTDVEEPPLQTVTFTATDEEFLNPERGFHDYIDLLDGDDLSSVREQGRTLAYAGVHLDAYRDAPLDDTVLDALRGGFAQARAARIQLILRFVYNDGGADASKARILGHIAQLTPVLADNADVIAVVQAGFIGRWGEWHGSTNGLDNAVDRAEILAAIVAMTPATRMVQVRTPMFKDEAYGGPITAGFDGTAAARVGHHNDCFLASEDDYGTYDTPIESWKDFVAAETRFTPWGGETCATNAPRTSCAAATAELERLHASFLNALYHPEVLDGWESGGCMDEIERRLGYRFQLVTVEHSERVAPGGILHLRITLENVGYAALYNPRPVVVVLGDESATLDLDPRSWEPGAPVTVDVSLRVPADQAAGATRLALRLPDPLLPAEETAIRFANAGTWEAGDNVLSRTLSVDPDAPGDVDPGATALVEITR